MEILKGMVKDAGYPDVECTYGKVDENTIYYFVNELPNGNVIASTVLKEAINHAPHTSLGVVDKSGNIIIPFEHKEIKQVKDELLFAEKNIPSTSPVVTAINNKADPSLAQKMTEDVEKIKEQMNNVMALSGDFIFENAYSEATLYTMDGINVSGSYFSFISENNSNYYFTTNILNDKIIKFNPEYLTNKAEESEGLPQGDVPNTQEEMPEGETPLKEEEKESTDDSGLSLNLNFLEGEENKESPENEEVPQEQPIEDTSIPTGEEAEGEPENVEDQGTEPASVDEETGQPSENIEEPLEAENNIELPEADDKEEEENKIELPDEELEAGNEEKEEPVSTVEEAPATEETSEEATPEEENIDVNNNSREITYDDMSNPVIADATNTIRKLLNENSEQRQQIDKLTGELMAIKTQYDIIYEENGVKEKEILSIRNELASARNVATALTRENVKLGSSLNKNNEIIKSLEDQNQKLRDQVAGLHALGNAVAEANVLIEPMEEEKTGYDNLD